MARRPAQTDPKPDRRARKKPKKQATVSSQEMAELCKGEVVAPRLGMVFKSFEEASELFDRYARHMGFGTKTRRSHKNRRTFELTCWKAGKTEQMRHAHCPRPTLISGCPTMIKVRKNIVDGLYNLIEVNLEHNHELYPLRLRFVRFKDQLSAGVKKHAEGDVERRARPDVTYDEDEYTSSINEVRRLRLERGDIGAICRFLHRMQSNDSNFFYLMDFDEEACLKCVFWADSRCRAACHYLGDVVMFDTTCLVGKCDMPLASFIGVNNHGQSVLLGCCLISNETSRTYTWLFKAWMSCMSGHKPNTIITDQCKAIDEAVFKVFPTSYHRKCLGHIMKRIPEKLEGHLAFKEIKAIFKKVVYDSLRVDEFERNWREMVWKYGLEDNEWFNMLYEDRNHWVPVFVKQTFCAGLSITQRGESFRSFFGHLESKISIKQFLDDYETTMESKYENEAIADFESFHKTPRMFSQLYMEEQICDLFTIGMFEKYQDEVKALIYCHPSLVKTDGSILTFEVKERVRAKGGKIMEQKNFDVVYNADEKEVHCICCSFQYRGILCRHALSVYNHQDVDEIPSNYIHERWRKDFKGVHRPGPCLSDDMVANGLLERHSNLHKCCLKLVEIGAASDNTYEFALKIVNEAMEKLVVEDFKCRGKQYKIVPCEAADDCNNSNTGNANANQAMGDGNDGIPDPESATQNEHQEWRGPSLDVLEYIESIRIRKLQECENPRNWLKTNNTLFTLPVDYQQAFANPSWPQWNYQQMSPVHPSNLFYYNGSHVYHPHYGIFLNRRTNNQPVNAWSSQQTPQVNVTNIEQVQQSEAAASGPKKKKRKRRKEKEDKEPEEKDGNEQMEREGEDPKRTGEEPIKRGVEAEKERGVEEPKETGVGQPIVREREEPTDKE